MAVGQYQWVTILSVMEEFGRYDAAAVIYYYYQ